MNKNIIKFYVGSALLWIPIGFILRGIFDSFILALILGMSMVIGFHLILNSEEWK